VKGKAKDIAGRVERQAGEWTGDSESQAKGTAKQVAGKLQNAWGKAKDATQDAADQSKSTTNPPGGPPMMRTPMSRTPKSR